MNSNKSRQEILGRINAIDNSERTSESNMSFKNEEIYKKLDLNQEEIDLIDKTIKKYEINSNFYKNMALGKTLI